MKKRRLQLLRYETCLFSRPVSYNYMLVLYLEESTALDQLWNLTPGPTITYQYQTPNFVARLYNMHPRKLVKGRLGQMFHIGFCFDSPVVDSGGRLMVYIKCIIR